MVAMTFERLQPIVVMLLYLSDGFLCDAAAAAALSTSSYPQMTVVPSSSSAAEAAATTSPIAPTVVVVLPEAAVPVPMVPSTPVPSAIPSVPAVTVAHRIVAHNGATHLDLMHEISDSRQRAGMSGHDNAATASADMVTISPDYGITNVTTQIGTSAYLPCKVKKIFNKSVSWVRVRDDHILTVDRITFIADERFHAFHPTGPAATSASSASNTAAATAAASSTAATDASDTWQLQIKYVQARDEGIYECQVSSEPKIAARISLNVVVPRTEMIGENIRYVKEGSKVSLHCIVTEAIEPPLYIIWYQGPNQIFPDNLRGWRTDINRESVEANPAHGTIGTLIIPAIKKRDSGNYTCSPSNSQAISTILHVINGEYSASAITSTATSTTPHPLHGHLIGVVFSVALLMGLLLQTSAPTPT